MHAHLLHDPSAIFLSDLAHIVSSGIDVFKDVILLPVASSMIR